MGLKISKYMLESIAQVASYNFQKITGRSEEIFWSNEEKDKYAVYLVGKKERTSFESLSGGEQVVVAISLREALNASFSNAKLEKNVNFIQTSHCLIDCFADKKQDPH